MNKNVCFYVRKEKWGVADSFILKNHSVRVSFKFVFSEMMILEALSSTFGVIVNRISSLSITLLNNHQWFVKGWNETWQGSATKFVGVWWIRSRMNPRLNECLRMPVLQIALFCSQSIENFNSMMYLNFLGRLTSHHVQCWSLTDNSSDIPGWNFQAECSRFPSVAVIRLPTLVLLGSKAIFWIQPQGIWARWCETSMADEIAQTQLNFCLTEQLPARELLFCSLTNTETKGHFGENNINISGNSKIMLHRATVCGNYSIWCPYNKESKPNHAEHQQSF